MEQKKDGYFTIGEIAKIMGVHPKSIRYYDRIGVLPPAMVDPETGYRYYKPSQLGILSAIQVCIELGIPLQKFSYYCDNGKIDAARFLEDAAEVSRQKIRAIQESMRFIEELQEQVSQADALIGAAEKVEYAVPEERFLVREISPDISLQAFNKVLGELHLDAVESGCRPGLRFGKMAFYRDGRLEKLYAFTSVSPESEGDSLLVLPPAHCMALHMRQSQILHAGGLFPDYPDMVVLESEMIASQYQTEMPDYELRCIPR